MSDSLSSKEIVIFGAGPAGLTAAYVLNQSGLKTTILEADPKSVGGISKTVDRDGFKFDIGGHRFFTKSAIVQELWRSMLPQERWITDVNRLSRIYYRKKFFHYPLSARDALQKLGLLEAVKCVGSYLKFKFFPIKEPKSFQEWVTNQFGKRLFEIFFKSYTEKVWGMSCAEISADWASQRIKGLSLGEAVFNSLPKFLRRLKLSKATIRTLSDKFDYPRLGPGELWENVKSDLEFSGCNIYMGATVTKISHKNLVVTSVSSTDIFGEEKQVHGNEFISTLPIRELINSLHPEPPSEIIKAANSLGYRDFLTVVLIYNQESMFLDNWIYIHDPSVYMGRIQNFKNWSPSMVPDSSLTSLGLEYFCFEGDNLWDMSDAELIALGTSEVISVGLTSLKPLKGYVVRCKKAYPIYDDHYKAIVQSIWKWVSSNLTNLQLVGRNGMHMYNNQDHSMLTGYLAAKNILGESHDLWSVNSSAEYHEDSALLDTTERSVPRKII
jgi:protoporphyrinogen oxidase